MSLSLYMIYTPWGFMDVREILASAQPQTVSDYLSVGGTIIGNSIFYFLWRKTDGERITSQNKVITLLETQTPVLINATKALERVEQGMQVTVSKVEREPARPSTEAELTSALVDIREQLRRIQS